MFLLSGRQPDSIPSPLETSIAPTTAPGYFAASMGTYRDLATIGTHAEARRGFTGGAKTV